MYSVTRGTHFSYFKFAKDHLDAASTTGAMVWGQVRLFANYTQQDILLKSEHTNNKSSSPTVRHMSAEGYGDSLMPQGLDCINHRGTNEF